MKIMKIILIGAISALINSKALLKKAELSKFKL